MFRAWKTPYLEIFAVQLPGRESRLKESCLTQLEPIVQSLLPALQPYLDQPFALFGHSMGALLAFEIARQVQPRSLFISACPAPQLPQGSGLHLLPNDEFLQTLRRYNGTPEIVLNNPELMALFLPILRADFTAIETYSYQPSAPLSCPIVAFGGHSDPQVNPDQLSAWSTQTSDRFRIQLFAGDHFYLNPQRQALLEAIVHE